MDEACEVLSDGRMTAADCRHGLFAGRLCLRAVGRNVEERPLEIYLHPLGPVKFLAKLQQHQIVDLLEGVCMPVDLGRILELLLLFRLRELLRPLLEGRL